VYLGQIVAQFVVTLYHRGLRWRAVDKGASWADLHTLWVSSTVVAFDDSHGYCVKPDYTRNADTHTRLAEYALVMVNVHDSCGGVPSHRVDGADVNTWCVLARPADVRDIQTQVIILHNPQACKRGLKHAFVSS